jgi:hypothetical protein
LPNVQNNDILIKIFFSGDHYMKKLLERIVSIALTVIGALLIALLLVVMFKAVDVKELDNQVVKILIMSLSVIFAILAALCIGAAFSDNDKLKAVLMFKDKESATKATVGVVKKLAIKAAKNVPNARVSKVLLLVDDNNNVKLRINLRVKGDDTENVINLVRAQITATIAAVLDVEFASVDFKLVGVKTSYKPDDKEIDDKVKEYKKLKEEAEKKAELAGAKDSGEAADSDAVDAAKPEATPARTEEAEVTAATAEEEKNDVAVDVPAAENAEENPKVTLEDVVENQINPVVDAAFEQSKEPVLASEENVSDDEKEKE